ncbi:MAG: LTA synthase family protein, partial [Bacteroidetes bacterium]
MEHELNKDRNSGREYLRDFTRMVLAFYGGLLVISLYQQIMLYSQGILGSVLSTNLFLSAVHHLGFTAILALILSFVFNALESRKPNLGARFCRPVFLGILTIEFLLTDYFTTRYEVPAFGIPESFGMPAGYFGLRLLLGVSVLSAVFYGIYSRSGKLQLWIGKMYPFTIVLFSMFLATLLS